MKNHITSYRNCAILIPEEYTNQYGEIVPFSNRLITNLASFLIEEFNLNVITSTSIEEIIQALKK